VRVRGPLVATIALLAVCGFAPAPARAGDGLESGRDPCVRSSQRGVNWQGRDMHGQRIHNVDLREANLHGVNLRSAILKCVDLRDADLRGADVRDAELTGVDLTGAKLDGALFDGARLVGVSISGSTLAPLPDAQVRAMLARCTGCDLAGADLHVDLANVTMTGDDLSGRSGSRR